MRNNEVDRIMFVELTKYIETFSVVDRQAVMQIIASQLGNRCHNCSGTGLCNVEVQYPSNCTYCLGLGFIGFIRYE